MSGTSEEEPVNRIKNLGSEKARYTTVLNARGTSTSIDCVTQKATL
jgi:hypothetical protein